MEILSEQKQLNTLKESISLEISSATLAEYAALREEILKRVEVMKQIAALVVIAFTAILPLGFQSQNATLLVLYPILVMFLAISWSGNDRRAREIGCYIRIRIESKFGENSMGWEHYLNAVRSKHRVFDLDDPWAISGLFIGTEVFVLSIGIPLAIAQNMPMPLSILSAIAIGSVLVTGITLLRPYRHEERSQRYTARRDT